MKYTPKVVVLTSVLIASGCAHNSISENKASIPSTGKSSAGNAPGSPPSKVITQKQSSNKLKLTKKASKSSTSKHQIKHDTKKNSTGKPSYPAVALNFPVEIKYGKKRALPDSNLWFKVSKINDNRCPLEMNCASQGNASVTLMVYEHKNRIGLVQVGANSYSQSENPVITDKYAFELLKLLPYPTVQFIDPQHYIAEIVIRKK